MNNHERKKERFLRDPLPVRLAGIAANLSRVSSSARRLKADNVDEMLEESRYYIEWTAAEAEPEVAAELIDIQLMLAFWRQSWPTAQHNPTQRTLLSFQAKKWSDQILRYSGMV